MTSSNRLKSVVSIGILLLILITSGCVNAPGAIRHVGVDLTSWITGYKCVDGNFTGELCYKIEKIQKEVTPASSQQ